MAKKTVSDTKPERKAARSLSKKEKSILIAAAAVAVCVVLALVVTTFAIQNNYYNDAVAAMNEGKYGEAISIFEELSGYKDSKKQIENCCISKFGEEQWNIMKDLKVNDVFTFGAYEQDNNLKNGKEAVEWIVVEQKGWSWLLVSKQALDCQQYNTAASDVTWEDSSVRKWMNGEFLNAAFSADEQLLIKDSEVSASGNPAFEVSAGNDTTDKVFLLSVKEAGKYFDSDAARMCEPTAYASSKNLYKSNSFSNENIDTTCRWWLRTPGDSQSDAAVVYVNGAVGNAGRNVDYKQCGIRPAVWIDLKA